MSDDPEELRKRVEELESELERVRSTARKQSVRFRSSLTIAGVPLVEVATGPDPEKGEVRGHAKAIIAVGDIATGAFAIGGIAQGAVAIGGLSIGLFSVGGCTVGILAAVGGVAMGTVAFGGVAIGYMAVGGAAIGIKAAGGAAAPLAQFLRK